MIISMRTTVVLDDRLFREAKRRAASLGTTLSEFLNQALREVLSRPPDEAPTFRMVTYGKRRGGVHHEPTDFSKALESEDAAFVGRR
jgi:hypothetical protein